MKKVLSIVLVVVMLASVFTIPAYASSEEFESEWRYYDRVTEYAYGYAPDEYGYREYIHYSDENSEHPDWVLMLCIIMPEPWEVYYGTAVGERVLFVEGRNSIGSRLDYGYTVYIVETDTFIDLGRTTLDQIIEQCPGFVEFIEENEIGRLFGDVNDSGELDIVDATLIQRYLAEYSDSEMQADRVLGCGYISDFNRDGERTILDATAIQMKLAKTTDTATAE